MTDANGATSSASTHIANRKPLRCRGYYYDADTGWYYLRSRYYDPIVKRFLNADTFASTGQGFLGYNMYIYCLNNPVNMRDSAGNRPAWETYENDMIGYTDSGTGTPQVENNWDYLEDRWRAETERAKNRLAGTPEMGITAVFGGTARAALGASLSLTLYLALDKQGNIVLYFSPGAGGGFPSASVGGFAGAIISPNANSLQGLGMSIGGSVCEGFKGGGDYIIALDQENGCAYHGGTVALGGGISAPVPVELHGEITYSFSVFRVNIYEILHLWEGVVQ